MDQRKTRIRFVGNRRRNRHIIPSIPRQSPWGVQSAHWVSAYTGHRKKKNAPCWDGFGSQFKRKSSGIINIHQPVPEPYHTFYRIMVDTVYSINPINLLPIFVGDHLLLAISLRPSRSSPRATSTAIAQRTIPALQHLCWGSKPFRGFQAVHLRKHGGMWLPYLRDHRTGVGKSILKRTIK